MIPTKEMYCGSRRLTLSKSIRTRLFREVSEFFQSVLYLHMIPQLVRRPEQFQPSKESEDPYGRRFLERIAKATPKTRDARLSEN